ncbi:TetR/AcrR family transcriptional regulator [Scatolibacter rhodanostii]|uniref:TetR/AcrR family transcriptional regulator n=1 Tax=Scatolibacter rhodanostii TaxID=2014781 RepID=UPI000C072134|nr:TetR/AcrR family transcriptional regulator [Scatolibacter rhodanostii]
MDKLSTRERIISAAYSLFKQKGYDAVSIQEICQICNLTKTAFYYHFPSKESLLIHFYDGVIEKISKKSVEFIKAKNYWEQIVLCFEELSQASIELGVDLTSHLYIMNLRQDKNTFDFNPVLTEICVALIEQAQATCQVRSTKNATELYQAAAFMFTGYEVMWCIKQGNFNRKKLIRQSLETILDVAPAFCLSQRISSNEVFNFSDSERESD